MNYQEAISYLEGLKIFGIRLGLSRITRLLELLGEPQDRYRTIHVTGTNGKGSVSAMLEGILRRSGIHTASTARRISFRIRNASGSMGRPSVSRSLRMGSRSSAKRRSRWWRRAMNARRSSRS